MTTYKPTEHKSEYRAWCNIRAACYNAASKQYKSVGARGISVEWMSFSEFMDDVGPKPGVKYMLVRTDPLLGFAHGNCKWVALSDFSRVKMKDAKRIMWNGRSYTTAEAAAYCGVSKTAMENRLATMDIDRAMTIGPLERNLRTPYDIADIQCTCRRPHITNALQHEGSCRKYNTIKQREIRRKRRAAIN